MLGYLLLKAIEDPLQEYQLYQEKLFSIAFRC